MERSNIPEELIEEILSRVPAKSLARWRSTSKRWNARLKSEIFVKMQSANAPKQSLMIMLIDFSLFRVYLVKPNLHGIHDNNVAPSVQVASQFYLKDPNFKSSTQVDICNVFHCDGLLLCTTKDNRLVVFNPCSGETKWIKPRNPYKESDCYALGYYHNVSSSSKQYKILRVDHHYNEIYDFTTDSWRVLCTDPDWSLLIGKKCCGRGMSVKGNTYWVACHMDSRWRQYEFLLSFDFSAERFRMQSHPHPFSSVLETLSVVRDDQLSLCSIWVTTIRPGSELSWTKFFEVVGQLNCPGSESSWTEIRNVSLIEDYDFSNGVSLSADDQDKLVLRRNKYVPEDPHGGDSTCGSSYPLLLNYVQSLTQIHQGTRDL